MKRFGSRPRHGEFQTGEKTELENPMKQTAMLEQDADGWWANRRLDDCTILGHGRTKEEALADLEKRVAGFADFLKRTRGKASESLRDS
jgi:hypothetical protein